MARILFIIITLLNLLALANYNIVVALSINCGGQIDGTEGELNIPAKTKDCMFTTAPETKDLLLNTDDIFLTVSDTLVIESSEKSHTYKAPTDAGYLHIGGQFVQPSLHFNFPDGNNPAMLIKFAISGKLPINADINHNFKIINVGLSPNLEMKFSKTLNETIHIQINPPQVCGSCILGNRLMGFNETGLALYVNAPDALLIHVTTTIVDKTCSNTYNSLAKPQEISGPQVISEPYKCVNLFRSASKVSEEAHFDVDFANFLSLAANGDELIIKDSSRRLLIDRPSEANYRGRKISNRGLELVVIYNSPDVSKNNPNLGLKLTIIPENFGGIVVDDREIILKANTPAAYTLVPEESKCISLVPTIGRLDDANLTLSVDGVIRSMFGPKSYLPPVLGTSEASKPMVLSYSGTKDFKLQYSHNSSCCNSIISKFYSVKGGQKETCYLTLASTSENSIMFDENNLTPNGCIAINSLKTNETLYSRCNISSTEAIPKFIIPQAYMTVSLPDEDTRFTMILGKVPTKLALSSPGYPVSYPIIYGNQDASYINATKRNLLLSVTKLDIRAGEKLLIGKEEITNQNLLIKNDLLFTNTTVNITVTRPTKHTDFGYHKGYKIAATYFEDIQILNGNVTANNTAVLLNLSNSLIKISSPLNRVNYIITLNKTLPDGFEMKAYDGRSIIKSPIATYLTGSTTSDTLMFTAKATKSNVTLPSLTINYWFSAYNKTNDLSCDNSTRFVPRELQCKGKFYCTDESDMRLACNSTGPAPFQPIPNGPNGVGGFAVFILCVFMLILGVLLSTYGPGLYKTLEDRFRGQGQYNSFTSVE